MPSSNKKKDIPSAKTPADIDELIRRFRELYGREVTREELLHLEHAKKLLAKTQTGEHGS